jgi:hypothetical protein
VRVLAHIRKRDDCFGRFLVRVTCKRGAVREIQARGPRAACRLVSDSGATRAADALLAVREEDRGGCSSCETQAAWQPEGSALAEEGRVAYGRRWRRQIRIHTVQTSDRVDAHLNDIGCVCARGRIEILPVNGHVAAGVRWHGVAASSHEGLLKCVVCCFVVATLRVVRASKRSPKSDSSRRMVWLSDDCVIPSLRLPA